MRIAIGLPTRAADASPDNVLEWATRAERGPFSSVAVTDRVAYDILEPLITLAAVASVTRRVGLITSIVLAPTRETTLLARQASSLNGLSGGRLVLGVAVGAREDDYLATGQRFHRRGRRLDAMLPELRRIWAGAGPEMLIGGYVPAVARRIARWGDGFMAPGGGDAAAMNALWSQINTEWSAAGRAGRPRWVSGSYFALGSHADDDATRYIERSYGADPAVAARRRRALPTTEVAVREAIARQAAMGVDEFILRPCSADLENLERLEEITAAVGLLTA